MSNVGKMSQVLNAYPVGSIYMSVNDTDPGELFGGSWERINGRFLLGAGSVAANTTSAYGGTSAGEWNPTVKTKGGRISHYITSGEMPSHRHIANGVAIKAGYQSSSTDDYFAMRSYVRSNITG